MDVCHTFFFGPFFKARRQYIMNSLKAFFILVVSTQLSNALILSPASNANSLLRWKNKGPPTSTFLSKRRRCTFPRVAGCALTLNAVAEEIKSDLPKVEDPQNITQHIRPIDELRRDNANDNSQTESSPILTVSAGRGAIITSSSRDVHIKSAGSADNLLEQPSQQTTKITVSPGRGANITSVSTGIAIDDQISTIGLKKKQKLLSLPLAKHLVKGIRNKHAVGKVLGSIQKVALDKHLMAASEETQSRKRSLKWKSNHVDWKSNIQSAVSDALQDDETRQYNETFQQRSPVLLPEPGRVLLDGSSPIHNGISVRSSVPGSLDDMFIANLRLSVFSNFDEERQNIFRARSVEVLNRRRRRGAVALVAELPHDEYRNVRSDNDLSTRIVAGHRYNARIDQRTAPQKKITGSVECSQHEFHRTVLGTSRPESSLLYVTEVAVCPEARRCGVGRTLMKGVEEVAVLRGVESIYLHVDVTNYAAIAMYEEAGYVKLDKMRPIYAQFTASLNLHDGALMGRCHYLMCKHLTETTWIDSYHQY